MAKKGFVYIQDDCVGCKTCQLACKDKNDLPVGTLFRHLIDFEVGTYPDAAIFHYAKTCNHCTSPLCVANCPTGAMYLDEEDGTVQHDDEMCIGCQTCVRSCPYGVPQYLTDQKIVRKCDACIALRKNGEQPACVAACQMRALEFGDIDELKAKHPGAVSDLPILPSSSTTSPCTIIQPKAAALLDGAVEVKL